MKPLYPDIRPFQTEMLSVGDGHELYVEQSGSIRGLPVIVLHGGPGAGASSQLRRFFDPNRYRIIVFDQRGAGRSKPHASIEQNTTQHLVNDMDAIRQHLGIQQWVVFGGSFGATLALLYAQQFPKQVCGLILRGVFLARQQDMDWLYKDGVRRLFPEQWADFQTLANGLEGNALVAHYHQLLQGANELAKVSAAKAWCRWEVANSQYQACQDHRALNLDTHTSVSMAAISAHFFTHHNFINENQILLNASTLAEIPGFIVHGRFDMICPVEQAWQLSQVWPKAELNIIREGGHSGFEAPMVDALVRATYSLANQLGQPETPA